jgi:hypothetical protein
MSQNRSGRSRTRAADKSLREKPGFNADESPLGWLARRKDKNGEPMIAPTEFNAGERLRADFYFAHLTPRVTASWSGVYVDGGSSRAPQGYGVEIADNIIAARERVSRALKAVGPDFANVLIDVCCHLKGLESVEKACGWPQRSGKIVLQLALRRLAQHYGFTRETTSASSSQERGPARIYHWGASDFRPEIQPGDAQGKGSAD